MKKPFLPTALRFGPVAFVALAFWPDFAWAGCSISGTIETCTGDLAAGVVANPPADTLLVHTLSANIAPGANTAGISMESNLSGGISGNVDLGPFQITTVSGAGIQFVSANSVDLVFNGAIFAAGGSGILAYSDGEPSLSVNVRSTGNISTRGDGATGIAAITNCCGTVSLASSGNISTNGTGAYGLLAQAQDFSSALTSRGNVTTLGAQSAGIAAFSNSSLTTISSQGNVTTSGNDSPGIEAAGATVTVASTGNITTSGSSSDGIVARSFFFNQGISIGSNGNIAASGDGSYGIHASSSSGSGNITVTNQGGTISGGQGAGAGIYFQGGANNVLTNYGTITSARGLAGTAVLGDTGNNTVKNYGTIVGNVTLGSGTNSFNNLAGATFAPGAVVNLGDGMTLSNGGVLSPGGSTTIQTTNLTGNVIFNSGGTYLVKVSPAASDQINISGTAAASGTANAAFNSADYMQKRYTILSAGGGLNGTTFSTLVATNLPASFHAALSYDANDVYLNLLLNFALPGGLNANQQALGNALANLFNSGSSIPLVYGTLTPAGLTQATGEVGTSSQQATFDAMAQFTNLLTDPFTQRDGGSSATGALPFLTEEQSVDANASGRPTDAFAMFAKTPPCAFEQRWSVWGAGFGGSQSTDGNAAVGSNNTASRIAGTAVGADYLFSPSTRIGFALAGAGTSFSVNGLGSGRSDLFQAGAYVHHTEGAAYISAVLAYGWQNITTDRYVNIAGVDHLHADFNANAYSGRAEGGYRFVAPQQVGGVGLTPYAAVQFATFDLPAYAEQTISGSSTFALSYASKSPTDVRSELGLRTDKSFAIQNGVLTLRGRVAWAHDYDPDRSIAATFQALPGASFVVNGAAQAHESALTTASAGMTWTNGWSVAATFEGEFSNVTRSYAGKSIVHYTW